MFTAKALTKTYVSGEVTVNALNSADCQITQFGQAARGEIAIHASTYRKLEQISFIKSQSSHSRIAPRFPGVMGVICCGA